MGDEEKLIQIFYEEVLKGKLPEKKEKLMASKPKVKPMPKRKEIHLSFASFAEAERRAAESARTVGTSTPGSSGDVMPYREGSDLKIIRDASIKDASKSSPPESVDESVPSDAGDFPRGDWLYGKPLSQEDFEKLWTNGG